MNNCHFLLLHARHLNVTAPSVLAAKAVTHQIPEMPLSTQEAHDDDQYVLLAVIDNAKSVSNILKAIHFKEVTTLMIKLKTTMQIYSSTNFLVPGV